jgi:pyruvate dehydrogenase E2 component (dihydrolipoamide acetyltransferase)
MPALGQSSDEMKLVQWFKPVGTHVDEGEPLFEAESDKTTLEVEAAATGTLLQVACQPGEIVASGTVIAWLGEPGEALPSTSAPTSQVPTPTTGPVEVQTRGPSPDGRVQATPAARTLAREHRVELSGLVGTGPDGRIERRDVQEVIDRQGSAGSATAGSAIAGPDEEPVPPQRQVIARRLARAALVPHFSISKTVDANAMRRLVAEVEGLTITHLLLQAVSAALGPV